MFKSLLWTTGWSTDHFASRWKTAWAHEESLQTLKPSAYLDQWMLSPGDSVATRAVRCRSTKVTPTLSLSCSVWIDSHVYMFGLGLISLRH